MSRGNDILTGPFGRAAILSLRAPLTTHAHAHCHLIIKLSGPDQRFVVEGRTLPLSDERAVLVNAWQEHSYAPRAHPEASRYLALYLDPHWLRSRDPMFAGSHLPGFFRNASARVTPAVKARAEQLCCPLEHDKATTETVSELVFQLMAELTRESGRSAPSHRWRDYRILRAQRYMNASYDKPFDYDAVARAAGLSRSRFNTLFRESVGVAPAIFGNAIRLEAAVAALESEARVQDVAIGLGFSSAGNFNRFFQQHTGVPPARYRRSMLRLPA